jgi:hypothetical protein
MYIKKLFSSMHLANKYIDENNIERFQLSSKGEKEKKRHVNISMNSNEKKLASLTLPLS